MSTITITIKEGVYLCKLINAGGKSPILATTSNLEFFNVRFIVKTLYDSMSSAKPGLAEMAAKIYKKIDDFADRVIVDNVRHYNLCILAASSEKATNRMILFAQRVKELDVVEAVAISFRRWKEGKNIDSPIFKTENHPSIEDINGYIDGTTEDFIVVTEEVD